MKNKKWHRSIRERLFSAVEIPAELAGIPKVTLTGSGEVAIEGHSGLVEYTAERITVNFGRYLISVKGSGLCLDAMDREDLLISGVVFSVEFIY